MHRFSRHLPPVRPAPPLDWQGWLGLAFLAPLFLILAPVVGVVTALGTPRERKRLARLKSIREDTICAFRRAFDCRKVDPWIIRATYEEVRRWIPGFPLEAKDDIENDLKLAGADIDDLLLNIAERSGYDLAATNQNPWYDRVKTVGDLVLFINHQPQTRVA